MQTKFAAMLGNHHWTQRVTRFFDTAQEAANAYPEYDYIAEIANWQEHEQWSKERRGMYAERQIER